MVPWNPAAGDTVEFTSLTPPSFGQRVDESEDYPSVNPVEGDTLSKRQIQYGFAMEISRKMAKFNKYPEALSMARSLVRLTNNILDLEMTQQIFGEADQTTFTPKGATSTVNIATADTLSLSSTAHTIQGAGGTWSNQSTAAVPTTDTLTTTIEDGQQNHVDDFGESQAPDFDSVVIGNNAHMTKWWFEILGSQRIPETANNAVSVYKGAMDLIILKHGTKNPVGVQKTTGEEFRWMIMDKNMANGSLMLQIAEDPVVEPRFLSSDNLVAKVMVTMFAAFAAVRAQGMQFNLNTSQPT